MQKPNRSVVSAEHEKAAYTDLQNAGTDAAAIKAVKAKWPEVFGPSALDKAIEAKTKASKETTKAAEPEKEKTSALPTKKTTTSDFSVSGGRGIYTVKGLPSTFKSRAEAEKAAQEAQKKRSEAEVTSAIERD